MQSTMNQQNKDTHASALLEGIYKNARMGADALLSLMPKVADSSLRRDLTAQLDGYQGYANKAEAYLCEQGTQAKDAGIFQKVATKVGIGVNTLMDSDTSHLAEMVIEGSNMNITESVKLLREHEICHVPEKALKLCRDMIDFEQKNVDNMQRYL